MAEERLTGQMPARETVNGVTGWRLPSGRFWPIIAGGEGDGAATGAGTGTDANAGDGKAQGDTSAGSQNTDTTPPGPVPYDRFKTVNDQLAELKKWKAEQDKAASAAKKAAEAAEAARLAEQGKFKELADAANAKALELEPFKDKAAKYEGALGKLLAKEREGLPKHILPLLDKLDAAEQLEYIADHKAELGKQPPPNLNAKDGQGGDNKTGLSEAERKELAARYGVKPEYLKL